MSIDSNKSIGAWKYDLLSIAFILISGMLIYFRNLYGFDWSDETFFPVGPYQLLIGDKLFEDFFGVGQFGNALLMPLVWIYRFIVGDLSGIMLFFRGVHNTFNICIALYCYCIFRKSGNKFFLLIVSLSIIVFTPFSVGSISYNTLSLQLLLLSGLFIAGYVFGEKRRKIKLILSGLSYGFATQMYPGLVFTILVIPIYLFYRKDNYQLKENRYTRVALWTLGGLIVIVLFFCFMVCNSSIESFINNFDKLFATGDATGYENRNITGVGTFVSICLQILIEIKNTIGANVYIVTVFTIIALIYYLSKKRYGLKIRYSLEAAWAIICICILITVVRNGNLNINYINIPLALMGPLLWLLCGGKNNVSVMIYILGLFECFAIQMGSNNGLLGSSYGLFICSVSVMIYMSMNGAFNDCMGNVTSVKTIDKTWLLKSVIGACLCFFVLTSFFYVRANYVYRDESIPQLTAKLETGPGKGIYTTPESKVKYEGICNEVRDYLHEDGFILFSNKLPFGYLLTEMRPAAPSTFRAQIASNTLEDYYRQYPEKIPDCVFLINKDVGITNEDNPIEGYFGKILLSGEYDVLKLEYSIVFIKKIWSETK